MIIDIINFLFKAIPVFRPIHEWFFNSQLQMESSQKIALQVSYFKFNSNNDFVKMKSKITVTGPISDATIIWELNDSGTVLDEIR